MTTPRARSTFTHPDPLTQRMFNELYLAMQQRQATLDELPMNDLAQRLGLTFRDGQLKVLERLIAGERWFTRLLVVPAAGSDILNLESQGVGRFTVSHAKTSAIQSAVFEVRQTRATDVNDAWCIRTVQSSSTEDVIRDSTGANLDNGGAWNNASSEALKEAFEDIDEAELLARLGALRVRRYHYKRDGRRKKHIGPTAEDFHDAFGLGDRTSISGVDVGAVALRANQALLRRNQELESRVSALEDTVRSMEARLSALEGI